MKTQPVLEEHHGVKVWANKPMDAARREECLCLACARLGRCAAAKRLYAECVGSNLALAVTRCPDWQGK